MKFNTSLSILLCYMASATTSASAGHATNLRRSLNEGSISMSMPVPSADFADTAHEADEPSNHEETYTIEELEGEIDNFFKSKSGKNKKGPGSSSTGSSGKSGKVEGESKSGKSGEDQCFDDTRDYEFNSKSSKSGSSHEYTEYLYIWSGHKNPSSNHKDKVSVIDFDERSPRYGEIINEFHIPSGATRKTYGNEPHHSLITTTDKGNTYLILGGLFNFGADADKDDMLVFKFNGRPVKPNVQIKKASRIPKFVASYNLPGACMDEINPIGNNEILVSMLCANDGGTPGFITKVNLETGDIDEDWSDNFVPGKLDSFSPHGFDAYQQKGEREFLISSDYIIPSSLFPVSPVFHNTLRRFDLDRSDPKLDYIYNITEGEAPGGLMDFRFRPGSKQGITMGQVNGILYFVDGDKEEPPRPIYNFDTKFVKTFSAGLMRWTADGNVVYMTYGRRYLFAFDTRGYDKPGFTLDDPFFVHDFCNQYTTGTEVFDCSVNTDFGANAGTHYLYLTPDEKRLVVVNYFVGSLGILNDAAANTVANFKIIPRCDDNPIIYYDTSFDLSFGDYQPHSVQSLIFEDEE